MPRRRLRKRKCCLCGELFRPHPAVGNRQTHCSTPKCQRARKAENNRAFVKRNPDYHRGPVAVARVQEWRRQNPGYWRRAKPRKAADSLSSDALQAEQSAQAVGEQEVALHYRINELQAELNVQVAVLHGVASHLTGCALQAELSSVLGEWHDKGVALGAVQDRSWRPHQPLNQGDEDAQEQLCTVPGTSAPCAAKVQLDRSSAYP